MARARTGIGFVAFCFEPGAESTIHISSVDDPNDPHVVSYEVESGDSPVAVVHKTGGGNDQHYQQPGNLAGAVTAGAGTFIGDERSASDPCSDGTDPLKFEGSDLTESTRLSISDEGEGEPEEEEEEEEAEEEENEEEEEEGDANEDLRASISPNTSALSLAGFLSLFAGGSLVALTRREE